jgi:hypothetical protein
LGDSLQLAAGFFNLNLTDFVFLNALTKNLAPPNREKINGRRR